MKHKAIAIEIINHGYEHSQYFQGCGTYGTDFDIVYTGSGDNAKDAYDDAVEQLYMSDIDSKSLDKVIPKRPAGIRKSDKVPAAITKHEENEVYWYVSIRVAFNEA